MTIDEKLVEEVARAMMVPQIGEPSEYWKRKAEAVIPLIQKDMLERMMEPSEGMLHAGQKRQVPGYQYAHLTAESTLERWQAMLRQAASEIGIEIE